MMSSEVCPSLCQLSTTRVLNYPRSPLYDNTLVLFTCFRSVYNLNRLVCEVHNYFDLVVVLLVEKRRTYLKQEVTYLRSSL